MLPHTMLSSQKPANKFVAHASRSWPLPQTMLSSALVPHTMLSSSRAPHDVVVVAPDDVVALVGAPDDVVVVAVAPDDVVVAAPDDVVAVAPDDIVVVAPHDGVAGLVLAQTMLSAIASYDHTMSSSQRNKWNPCVARAHEAIAVNDPLAPADSLAVDVDIGSGDPMADPVLATGRLGIDRIGKR